MKLLSPLELNSALKIKNRIIMAPLTRSRIENNEKVPGELQALYYRQRASAGLIISEGTAVSNMAVGYLRIPGIYTKEQVDGWKKVTKTVHEAGGMIFCQLWHVGRITHPNLIDGKIPLSASAINHFGKVKTYDGIVDSVSPKAMDASDIEMVKIQFVDATKNAMEAGFDGVEIHSSNGYLFHQFFSASSNERNDNYGGSPENKARFLFEVLEAIAEIMPIERIGLRFNPMMHQAIGIQVDEHTLPVFDYIVNRLNDYPIAYIHLTRPSNIFEADYFEKDLIGRYRKIYRGIIIANADYSFEDAEQEISSGRADAVAFGKLFISNPNLVECIEKGLPLKAWDHPTFYTPGEKGYTVLD